MHVMYEVNVLHTIRASTATTTTAATTTTTKTESPSSTLERETTTGGHTVRERTQSLTEQMVSKYCCVGECSIRVCVL